MFLLGSVVFVVLATLWVVRKAFTPVDVEKNAVSFLDPRTVVSNVCVIGAGSSGLACAKEMLEAGFEVTVFESRTDLGGNWLYNPSTITDGPSVHACTYINTSRQMMSFSDYPMPRHLPIFSHHSSVLDYFRSYAKHFGLLDHIHYGHTVISVSLEKTRGYAVTTRNNKGEEVTHLFDAVYVANGHHSVPNFPSEYPNWTEKFQGKIFHSRDFRSFRYPYDCSGKRVLVVGSGNSAVDIACYLANVSKTPGLVTVSCKSIPHVYPKFFPCGIPIDQMAGRWIRCLPALIQRGLFRLLLWISHGNVSGLGVGNNRDIFEFPAIGSEFVHLISQGTIRIVPPISEVKANSVRFRDHGKIDIELPFDYIILCTGFQISFPFLPIELQPLKHSHQVENLLYRHMWLPALGPTFGFIGFVQPIGASMPIAEMQSLYIAAILKRRAPFPDAKSPSCIPKSYQDWKSALKVSTVHYTETLADILHIRPNLISNISLLIPLLFGPTIPAQYRLNGRWNRRHKAITTIQEAYDCFKSSPSLHR